MNTINRNKTIRRGILLLSYLLLTGNIALLAQEQEEKPVYFERLPDGKTQFYFDSHYFLTDRSCQYEAIERVGTFDVSLKAFDGPFVDYDTTGNVVLTGQYQKGKKEGVFTGYFPNGRIMHTISFREGIPVDTAVYNYPDGLPMLEVVYKEGQGYVWNFWDTRRRQRIIAGNGRFEFAVKAEGYSEEGYAFINYVGRITNGKPDGQWDINYIFPHGEQEYAAYERFEQGRFRTGYNVIEGSPYLVSQLQIGPIIRFEQAEGMVSKGCTIDENQDFNIFLMKRLEKGFSRYDSSAITTKELAVDADVRKDGSLKKLNVIKGFEEDEQINKLIAGALESVSYWIPSYKDGEYVEDIFHITMEIAPDEETKQLRFYNLRIERENGI